MALIRYLHNGQQSEAKNNATHTFAGFIELKK